LSEALKIFIVLAIVVLLGILICHAKQINHYAKAKQILQYEMFSALSAEGRIDDISDSLIDWLVDKILPDKFRPETGKEDLRLALVLIDKSQNKINRLSIDFALIAIIAIALAFVARTNYDDLALCLLLVSAICLWVGLTVPILTIESSKELPLLGKTIFQYESKGIIGSIKKLLANGNTFLAYLLLLFSVILPFAKTLTLVLINLVKNFKYRQKISDWFSHLGKWSMTDVFVVAILVVFFASSNSSITKSQTENGLYFFTFYVILSLIASVMISFKIKFADKAPDPE